MSYRHQLPSGVRIVGEEIPFLRSVAIGIWIGTGSRFENKQNNGVSHFLEHMFFKGTERYSAKALAELFDNLGGQVNAFTSKEYTCFYARVLDDHFEIAADTLSDMLLHSQFQVDEMDKERKVVIEEIHMYEDTPDELVMDLLAEGIYGEHSLGFTILGLEENLRSFSRQDLLSYIESRYQGNDIVISVAGNISEARVIETFGRLFGHYQPSGTGSRQLVEPPFRTPVVVRQKDIEQMHVALAAPGLPAGHPDMYALILMNNALGSNPSSRLFQEIREERGMAYSVFSYHSSYLDCGMFGIYTGTSPENLSDVLQLIQECVARFAEQGLSEEELNKGKAQLKGSMMLGLESTSSRMSRLGKNELLLRRSISIEETLAAIDAVRTEDVLRVSRQLLQHPFAISTVGPMSEVDVQAAIQNSGWVNA
ncbi:M16 family metallopeptidase [Alicyclobacillus tolerans]|uniref:Zn-dependent peptidase n=1 Tax=Alicyclobacillus tolerans TaxID=90970 RepID=A0ABT9LXB7_9BACL|nr:pitrilysin family protein [Alicyclobacillus tengchongensis]MDP9728894.1 putative Zn-dependent peptidase [Alicyclobacillus tengchongensis]